MDMNELEPFLIALEDLETEVHDINESIRHGVIWLIVSLWTMFIIYMLIN